MAHLLGNEKQVAPANPATRYRTVIFIDFWNLEYNLLHHALKSEEHAEIDWNLFSEQLVRQVEMELSGRNRPVLCDHEGTRVYAAAKPSRTEQWFLRTIGLAPRHTLSLKKRDKSKVRCLDCGRAGHPCSNCGQPLIFDQEKGVDAALVTDLLWLAWQDLYDLAVVISSDKDLIAGIERVQLSGRKVVNARFPGLGDEVARTSWAALDLDWMLDGSHQWPQIWDVPGIGSTAWRDTGIDDANDRLIRGTNPLTIVAEARSRFDSVADATRNWLINELSEIESEARDRGFKD